MQYKYKALDVEGKEVEGTLEATSQKEALTAIRNDKLFPVNVKVVDPPKSAEEIESEANDRVDGFRAKLEEQLEELEAERAKLEEDDGGFEEAIDEFFERVEKWFEGGTAQKIVSWFSERRSNTDRIETQLKEIATQLKQMNVNLEKLLPQEETEPQETPDSQE